MTVEELLVYVLFGVVVVGSWMLWPPFGRRLLTPFWEKTPPPPLPPPPALTADQEVTLQRLFSMLSAAHPDHILQGFHILDTLEDPVLLEALARGIYLDQNKLCVWEDAPLGRYLEGDMLQVAALHAAVRIGLFGPGSKLELRGPDTDENTQPLLAGLAGIQDLEELDMRAFHTLSDLSPLKGLHRLRKLALVYGLALETGDILGELTALEELDLSYQQGLEDISALASLQKLRVLKLRHCIGLEDISTLGSLGALELLILEGCTAITDVSTLVSLTNLERVDLRECTGLPEHLRWDNITLETLRDRGAAGSDS